MWASAWALALLWVSAPALAQSGGASASDNARGGVAAEVGYERVDAESFLGLRLKFGYKWTVPQVACAAGAGSSGSSCDTELDLLLQAPLRLRVFGASTPDAPILRREDWDEATDYLKILRRLEYGRAGEPLHARVGALGPISLGHGSVVGHYYNVITANHYRMGAAAEVNTQHGGAQVLVDSVTGPGVVGARAFVRPWAFVDADHFLSRFTVGATYAADIHAPTRLGVVRTPDASARQVRTDDALNPVVEADQLTTVLGADVELALIDSATWSLVPYADFVTHTSLGSGVHAGVFVHNRSLESVELGAQFEYRRVGARFLPVYFGPVYQIERYQFAGWGQAMPAPKVRATASLGGEAVHGFYGALTARVAELFSASVAFADHEGADNALANFRASLTPHEAVHVGVFYHKQYFDGLADLLDLDGALIASEAHVDLYGPLYVFGRYGRLWQIDLDGRHQTVDDWGLGLGASMGF